MRAVLTAVLALAAIVPSAPAAVVQYQYGAIDRGMPITGSDQHLPPLAVTATYTVPAAMGPDVAALRASGGYTADIRGTVAQARAFLDDWLDERCGPKADVATVQRCRAMVVSDIDDTIVSWYPYYSSPAQNWAYASDTWGAWEAACTAPPIRQTVALLHYAQRRGVALALITGRKTPERAVTAACLERIGITGYRYLILRTPSEVDLTAAVYKAQRRQILERAGWDIALSIGDQVSDMTGGYADHGFLLPNPLYFIP